MSQKEFANFLAVSHKTAAKWEQGGNQHQGVASRLMEILADQGEELIKVLISS